MSVDFDEIAQSYDESLMEKVSFFEKDDTYFPMQKATLMRRFAAAEPAAILEFGCGVGRNLSALGKVFPRARLFGCDLSDRSLEMAAERCPEAVLYNVRDEVKRPSGAYDMILVANVFHHIPPHLRQAQMAQVSGLLKAGGDLFFFEHNPFNPVTRRIVSTCPMDRDAELIRPRVASDLIRSAGLRVTTKRYTLFFPAALRVLRSLENRMWWLPLGGQYFLKAVK